MGDRPGPPAPLAGRPAPITSAAAAAAAPSPAAFFFFKAWDSPSTSRLALSRPDVTGDPNAERPIAGVAGDATVSERIFSPTRATRDGVLVDGVFVEDASVRFSSSFAAAVAAAGPGPETGLSPNALERRRRTSRSPFFALSATARLFEKSQSKHRLHDAA